MTKDYDKITLTEEDIKAYIDSLPRKTKIIAFVAGLITKLIILGCLTTFILAVCAVAKISWGVLF